MPLNLKRKLKSGALTVGSWITIGDMSIAEIMVNAGFDWLTVDMEHSAITLDRAQMLIQSIGSRGVPPLVRVGENDPNLIKRVMDIGAYGVIVPMVNSAEDALNAVESVKYPPLGRRGVGLARAQMYGLGFERYRKWLAEESVVIVQIEHADAVENIEQIITVPGVDAFIVGPYDLSASMGITGRLDHPRMKKALDTIIRTARRCSVPAGFHVVKPDAAALAAKAREGYRFIGFSFDALLLASKCGDELAAIRRMVRR